MEERLAFRIEGGRRYMYRWIWDKLFPLTFDFLPSRCWYSDLSLSLHSSNRNGTLGTTTSESGYWESMLCDCCSTGRQTQWETLFLWTFYDNWSLGMCNRSVLWQNRWVVLLAPYLPDITPRSEPIPFQTSSSLTTSIFNHYSSTEKVIYCMLYEYLCTMGFTQASTQKHILINHKSLSHEVK